MALDVTGAWDIKDDLLVMEVLELPFSNYTKECLGDCMNAIEQIDYNAVGLIKGLLTEFKTAQSAESSNNMAQSGGGKTLVKADVLEWEIDHSQVGGGPQKEVKRIRREVALYFSGCNCLGGHLSKYTNNNGDNMMYVYRS